jgi:hypothetical protein
MGCNCKVTEIILGIIILIFAIWTTSWSDWIIIIAAVLLIIHALTCKNCNAKLASAPAVTSKAKKRKRR